MAPLTEHVPVLLHAVLEGLDPKPGGRFIDCTLGGAGHTMALLDRTGPDGRVFAPPPHAVAIPRAPPPPGGAVWGAGRRGGSAPGRGGAARFLAGGGCGCGPPKPAPPAKRIC